MSEPIETPLNNCDCCEPGPTSAPLYNRPGLPALSYRRGTYATFFRRMLSRLGTLTLPDGDFGGTRPLAGLTIRSGDDPAIALLDASAVVADVLTFYQERIADEGFLRTATERRSILEMARAIGYELNPGVAASVYLAFTVEDAIGAPGMANIPAGTKVQSIPPQDKTPQTFETSRDITARTEWNALRPRLTYKQIIDATTTEVYLQGTATNLNPGDRLLLVDSAGTPVMVQAIAVDVQSDKKRTRVDFVSPATPPKIAEPPSSWGSVDITTQVPLKQDNIGKYIYGLKWTESDLNAFLTFNQWDLKQLRTFLSNERKSNPASSGSIYALRKAVGFFGNNAPAFASLPSGGSTTGDYGRDWDKKDRWQIWMDQQAGDDTSATALQSYFDVSGADVYLERVVPGLVKDFGKYPRSWAVFEIPGDSEVYLIDSLVERSLGAFAMSGKVTGLILKNAGGGGITKSPSFLVRNTTAYLQSEPLDLVEVPMDEALDSDPSTLVLDGLVLGLTVGQAVTLTGERTNVPGVTVTEALILSNVNHLGGFTELTFQTGRQNNYKRSTLSINANIALATHGEAVTEILGSGNGAQANQKFTLRKPPLTYTAAANPSGSASTLQLRVNNLLWDEASSLYELGSNDQSYAIRLDDDGKPNIIFGDGERGAPLPTGVNNVVATYRSGIGLAGQVEAGSLTILQSRPLGVKGVNNPLPAGGAGDPEKMEKARDNAPLTVRTLDRIVSREDYQDFAAAFAGIGKAQAIDLWSGEHHLVHLTVAGEDGQPVTDTSFMGNFMDALDKVRDPTQSVKVDTFSRLLFNLTANVAVDSRYVVKDVFAAVESALTEAFSFPKRGFGQGVTAAEVITVIQKIAGVVFVEIELLYPSGESEDTKQILTADIAHVGTNNLIQPAQLLLINTFGLHLQEIKA